MPKLYGKRTLQDYLENVRHARIHKATHSVIGGWRMGEKGVDEGRQSLVKASVKL